MRTLRLALVGTVILALLGGPGAVAMAQEEEMAETPTWVTGEAIFSISQTEPTGLLMASDPRLSGNVDAVLSWRSLTDEDDSAVWTGTMTMENKGGSWEGRDVGLRGPAQPWVHRDQWELVGHGGYEGLAALLFFDGEMGLDTFEGLIFEGELPTMPE